MPAKRTEPSVHCFKRPMPALPNTGYVGSGHPASHLAAVFAAERERQAIEAAKAKRRRKPKALAGASEENPNQLRLVS
ncbi:hypothetical protein D3C71_1489770 [compost metagenome]